MTFRAATGGNLADEADTDLSTPGTLRNGTCFEILANFFLCYHRASGRIRHQGILFFGTLDLPKNVDARVQAGRRTCLHEIRDRDEREENYGD